MSRTVIGGIVAISIAALTALIYILVTSSLPAVARREARETVARVPDQAVRNASLEALDLSKKVEQFAASDAGLRQALLAPDVASHVQQADLAFGRYRAQRSVAAPDLLVVVNAEGDVIARGGGDLDQGVLNPVAGEFKKDGKLVWPAIELAISQRAVLSEVWSYQGGLFRIGIATVVDVPGATGGSGKILGAVIIGQALGSRAAAEQAAALGTAAAYFDGDRVFATSFGHGNGDNKAMQDALTSVLPQLGASVVPPPHDGDRPTPARVAAGGERYLAMAVRMPRLASIELPAGYPAVTASLLVLVPETREIPEHGKAGHLVLLLGALALLAAVAGMFLASKRILDQVDQVELGVAEIINGNTERTFRPVGAELDGLSNSLNVMLARLMGRPEPSDDDYDEDGDATPSQVEFTEASRAHSAAEAELAALAGEPEAAYYQRVHQEYRDAREAAGSPDPVSLESFTAKLRVNEGKLKAQHHCKMVRFKVVAADGKVTLKPVPIA